MKKIRKGNDIQFIWTILDGEGQPYDLEGKPVIVHLTDRYGKEATYTDLSIAENVVSLVFRGKDQKTDGKYTLELVENDGRNGMHSVDIVDAVVLVQHSFQEGGEDSCSHLHTETVELTSQTSIGIKGDAATIEVVETTTGAPGTNASVTNSGDEHDAKLHFVIPRGQKGDPGSDADVTAQNIERALGYVPVAPSEVPDELADLADDADHRLVTDAEKSAWNAKYDKPSNGIPSTDMAEGVQQSLGRADSAYQKPSGGIPKTDLASGVQESLGKADASATQSEMDSVTAKIPAQASSSNQLADKEFVNSSIATATATHRGTYNLVSDLGLTTSATEQQIAAAIATKLAALSITADNNDYVFVQIPTADATPSEIERVDRYKYNGSAWGFEFSLNNSGFTAAQWAAINSGITEALVAAFNAKYDKPSGGIPKSDMDAGVQSSLDKADSALQQHQDISGKANKSEMIITDGTGVDFDKTTIQLKNGTSAKVLKSHQDISGKEDKSNKVNSISGSSTDTEYPSAKATHDAIKDGSVKEAVKLTTEIKANQEFVFRAAQNTIGADALTLNSIKGNTVVWNQKFYISDSYEENGITIETQTSAGAVRIHGTYSGAEAGAVQFYESIADVCVAGHKYLCAGWIGNSHINRAVMWDEQVSGYVQMGEGSPNNCVFEAVGTGSISWYLEVGFSAGETVDFTIYPIFVDLTVLFNGNVPANFTVDDFFALFPDYDPSGNTGELLNNTAKALETLDSNNVRVGCLPLNLASIRVKSPNIWDEQWELGAFDTTTGALDTATNQIRSKNYIPVIPNMEYYCKCDSGVWAILFDASHNVISLASWSGGNYSDGNSREISNGTFRTASNAAYMKFYCVSGYGTTYNHDICINESSSFNGNYEPHDILTIQQPMKSAGSVRNEIKDGKFYKRADVRAYVSGDENDSTVITDGTNTNYALATEEVYELAEPMMLSMPAGTTERIIADGLSAPMVCDMTYGVNPAQLLDDMNALSKGAVPSVYDSIPSNGFLPNVAYDLGTLTGTVAFTLATGAAGKVNHYVWSFDSGSTPPTITTWPTGVSWVGGVAHPDIIANKHYEISIYNGVGVWMEV